MLAGALPFLIAMLQSPQQSAQTAVLEALGGLTMTQLQTCDAMISAGTFIQ